MPAAAKPAMPTPANLASKSPSNSDEKNVLCPGLQASAKVMVALDFGTTFSGFAYAHRSDPFEIHTTHDWPSQTEAAASVRYCKTQTSLFYTAAPPPSSSAYALQAWGWPALLSFQKLLRDPSMHPPKRPRLAADATSPTPESLFSHVHHDKIACARKLPDGSHFVSCFKLYLAYKAGAPYSSTWSCAPLPDGLDIDRLVVDYLRQLSEFVVDHLRDRYGPQLKKREIQWCLTVPAIWAEQAKQKMKQCARMAGLSEGFINASPSSDGPSPHPLRIILEPEAASLHCLHRARYSSLKDGDKFAVIDVGGATIDLVVHEKVASRNLEVKEVSRSVGCLGGGIFVDEHFLRCLGSKIPCLWDFLQENPSYRVKLLSEWQSKKFSYDGKDSQVEIDLPFKLAQTWMKIDLKAGHEREKGYGEVILTCEDLLQIMNPEVDKVIDLLEQQMGLNLQAIFMVGGFSASPYLMKRVHEAFQERVKVIISPPDPGSAICQGAVLFCMSKEPVTCRISRKTYGISCWERFIAGEDPIEYFVLDDDGRPKCKNAFSIFVKIGDVVLFDQNEEHVYYPVKHGQTRMSLALFSTTESSPKYTTGKECVKEGEIVVNISQDLQKDKSRQVCVSMHFGRSTIEMSARGLNFGDGKNLGMLPVAFQQAVDVVS